MKKLSIPIFSLFTFAFLLFTSPAYAKILPQASKAVKSNIAVKPAGSGINVSPRLRSDRRALIVYFSNLQNAKSVSYALTYSTSEQEEGAMGAINYGKSSSTSQELLFGTCSKGVCRYHTGIKNMKLEVSYTTVTGKKYIKRFKIRV